MSNLQILLCFTFGFVLNYVQATGEAQTAKDYFFNSRRDNQEENGPFYVKTGGDDETDCTDPDHPCASFLKLLQLDQSGVTIFVIEEVEVGEEVRVDKGFALVSNEVQNMSGPPSVADPTCEVHIGSSGHFSIGNQCSFTYLLFKQSGGGLSNSLWSVNYGILEVMYCRVEEFVLVGHSLLETGADLHTPLIFDHSIFTDIFETAASGGKAAVADVTLTQGQYFLIGACSFIRCNTTSGLDF